MQGEGLMEQHGLCRFLDLEEAFIRRQYPHMI
jgi:hypothetical protein